MQYYMHVTDMPWRSRMKHSVTPLYLRGRGEILWDLHLRPSNSRAEPSCCIRMPSRVGFRSKNLLQMRHILQKITIVSRGIIYTWAIYIHFQSFSIAMLNCQRVAELYKPRLCNWVLSPSFTMHRRDAQIHTVMATDGEATESGCPSGIQSWAWRAATVGLGPILEDSTWLSWFNQQKYPLW